MASASPPAPVLAPVEERLAAAIAHSARMEREVTDLEQEKVRLHGRTDAAALTGGDHAAALMECQSRLDTARQRQVLAETTVAAYAQEQAKAVAQRHEMQTRPAAVQSAPVSHTLYRALRSQFKANIPSPSRSDKSLLVAPFAHFMAETPLTVKTDLSPVEYAAFSERPDTYSAGREAAYIREALQYLPVVTRVVGKGGSSGKMSAKRLFPAGSRQSIPFVRLPRSCFPELAVRSDRGYPGFSGELKSRPPVSWNEALTYVTMSMLDSLFPASESHDVYHFRPPTGYALLAMAGSGFFSAVEWVARLFIGPITPPFSLGSEQHKAAVNKLDIVKVERWVELNVKQSVGSSSYPADAGEDPPEVIWSSSPAELQVQSEVGAVQLLGNRFFKIITHKAFSHLSDCDAAYQFRHLHRMYTMYAELFEGVSADGAKDRPRALVSARLLYGVCWWTCRLLTVVWPRKRSWTKKGRCCNSLLLPSRGSRTAACSTATYVSRMSS